RSTWAWWPRCTGGRPARASTACCGAPTWRRATSCGGASRSWTCWTSSVAPRRRSDCAPPPAGRRTRCCAGWWPTRACDGARAIAYSLCVSHPARSILYHNGVVHSSADPFAEALLVDDGVVAWVGTDHTAAALAAGADRVGELAAALVSPGAADAHGHVRWTGLAAEAVDLGVASAVRSLRQALAVLRGRARRLAVADPSGAQVLLAVGWDAQAWPE